MILPRNGKVVIFDDKYEDVKGLLGTLSQNHVPFHYFQDEGGGDLPKSPIKNVRLIFLDLELITGQAVNAKNIIGGIAVRLQSVLEINSKYILIYWSTKEEKYKQIIDEAFANGLKEYKPIMKLSLNKIEALKQKDPISFISSEISANFEDFKLFEIFSLWENLVNDSAGNLINDFTDFIDSDENWDDGAKYVLYKLAQAYSGKRTDKKAEPDQLQDAFFTLNHTFIDAIESSVINYIIENESEIKGLISSEGTKDVNYSSVINRRLLISQMKVNGLVPGSLFFPEKEIDERIESNLKDVEKTKLNERIPKEKIEDVIKKVQEKCDENNAQLELNRSLLNKNYNRLINDILIADSDIERSEIRKRILHEGIKIELNISPLCDFAQDKMPYVRIIPGLLIKADEFLDNKINVKNAFNYFSDGVLQFDKIDYKLAFDFRFLYSQNESQLKGITVNFKLRHQILADIQLKLGSHINRSGVLFVQ